MIKKTFRKKTAVIVPVYNEEKIIKWVISGLTKICQKLPADIIIVNDGSTDNTIRVIEKFKNKIKILSYKENRGKGFALRLG